MVVSMSVEEPVDVVWMFTWCADAAGCWWISWN